MPIRAGGWFNSESRCCCCHCVCICRDTLLMQLHFIATPQPHCHTRHHCSFTRTLQGAMGQSLWLWVVSWPQAHRHQRAGASGSECVTAAAAGQGQDGVIPGLGESLLLMCSSLFHPGETHSQRSGGGWESLMLLMTAKLLEWRRQMAATRCRVRFLWRKCFLVERH